MEEGKLLMEEVVETFKRNLGTLRTGRANASMLYGIEVDYYGAPTPLEQMSQISISEGRQLVIKPFDPSSLKDIEHTLNESDLDYPVQNDGTHVRINIPPLTEETRREESKKIGQFAEDARVQIRNIRRDLNDDVKKQDGLPEDQEKSMLDEVQKLTDEYIAKIDQIAKDKEQEIMTV